MDRSVLMPWYQELDSFDYGEQNNRLKRHDDVPVQQRPKFSSAQQQAKPEKNVLERRVIVDKHPPVVGESPNGVEVMTMAELTAAGRMALRRERPFAMVDDRCQKACAPWFEQQRRAGLRDMALVCTFTLSEHPEILENDEVAVICWYENGTMKKVTTYHDLTAMKLVIREMPLTQRMKIAKPSFPAPELYDALLDIAQVARTGAPTDYWYRYFSDAAQLLKSADCDYAKTPETFYLPEPYYKYLLAVRRSRTGMGMGSWYDLPITGSTDFKIVTAQLVYQQFKALLYAVNNC